MSALGSDDLLEDLMGSSYSGNWKEHGHERTQEKEQTSFKTNEKKEQSKKKQMENDNIPPNDIVNFFLGESSASS